MSNEVSKICLVIGSPIAHSLSPTMHNAAYKALGIESQFAFLGALVGSAELPKFVEKARAKKLHMLAVTIPHKETIIDYLDELDPIAKEIGAVNTVINRAGKLIGYNTDSPGAIAALQLQTNLKDKKVAVLGSGGTAMAILYGLAKEKVNITIFSRNIERANELAAKYGAKVLPWEERDKAFDSDIIINTTPVGRDDDELPISSEGLNEKHIVFDVNYNVSGTPLLNEARKKGAIVIDGLELLLQQGILQFELYTGMHAPEQAMRKALKISKPQTNVN